MGAVQTLKQTGSSHMHGKSQAPKLQDLVEELA